MYLLSPPSPLNLALVDKSLLAAVLCTDCSLLACQVMWSGRNIPTLCNNQPPLSISYHEAGSCRLLRNAVKILPDITASIYGDSSLQCPHCQNLQFDFNNHSAIIFRGYGYQQRTATFFCWLHWNIMKKANTDIYRGDYILIINLMHWLFIHKILFSLKLCTDRPPRTLIEGDSNIFCMCTTVSSWRWALEARNM